MNKIILLLLSGILFTACNKKQDQPKTTWIGGEIINPGLDYVILSRGNQLLDTVKLDDNNRFLYEAKNIVSGLYSFKNKEYQAFYLEPGDSLMLRVNTWDFDESLAYSGRGAEKNNLLMDFFLQSEEERQTLQNIYRLSPIAFERKIDSMRTKRLDRHKMFVEDFLPSESFEEVAMAGINYDYYSKKEQYTNVNKYRALNDPEFKYPANFYSYRSDLDFNNEALRSYYPYFSFLKSYVDNLAYADLKDKTKPDNCSYSLNHQKLIIIDSLVKNDSLRNDLLRTKTRLYLLNAKKPEDQRKILEYFLKVNNNIRHQSEISQLAEMAMQLSEGNIIPNITLLTYENTVTDLHKIIKRPTVLYFWSDVSVKHYKDIHAKATEMKSKYPEYDFIGINTDSHFKKWRDVIKNSNYNPKTEFELEDPKVAEKSLIINSSNKAIIVNKDLKIFDSNTNMNNADFETLLLGYLNKKNS